MSTGSPGDGGSGLPGNDEVPGGRGAQIQSPGLHSAGDLPTVRGGRSAQQNAQSRLRSQRGNSDPRGQNARFGASTIRPYGGAGTRGGSRSRRGSQSQNRGGLARQLQMSLRSSNLDQHLNDNSLLEISSGDGSPQQQSSSMDVPMGDDLFGGSPPRRAPGAQISNQALSAQQGQNLPPNIPNASLINASNAPSIINN